MEGSFDMTEEKIVKAEKIFSFASIALTVAALVSIVGFQSKLILPYVFALLYLSLMASQVLLPVMRYGEIFNREKKMYLFPVVYGALYTAVFSVFYYFYIYSDSESNLPLYILAALMLFQMIFPMYSAIIKVTDKHPSLFPLYYEDLQKKKEAERRKAEEARAKAEEELRRIAEAEKKELEEHPEKSVDFDEFFFGDSDEDKK